VAEPSPLNVSCCWHWTWTYALSIPREKKEQKKQHYTEPILLENSTDKLSTPGKGKRESESRTRMRCCTEGNQRPKIISLNIMQG
jgi:sucrose-6-phosphate hydrolase SacC (GH32 family)